MNHVSAPLNLRARARQALIDAQFQPDFPAVAQQELQKLNPVRDVQSRDLRNLLWSSIDNEESRDLDQIEFAEKLADGAYRLLIGIADVDSLVSRGSAIDQHAAINTTSIYTGVATFAMLPEKLSTELTSLLEGQDSLAVVIDLHIDASGDVAAREVFRARVRNRAKLVYESVGDWLANKSPPPPKIAASPELESQVRLQFQIAQMLHTVREQHGELAFGSVEAKPVMRDNQVVDLKVAQPGPAREIIESFMITANVAMANYLKKAGFPAIRRVVRVPKRWDRICELAQARGQSLPQQAEPGALSAFLSREKKADPLRFPDLSLAVLKLLGPGEYVMERAADESLGHFGLGLHDYTHSTAPNRRYADLITQRLLKALITGEKAPYPEAQLAGLAAHCTERENAVRKVERLMRKVIAAAALATRIGEAFDAVVTGSSPKGTYVRLLNWPAEGRVLSGERGIDVGDKVRVRLLSTDPWRGFIDFEKI